MKIQKIMIVGMVAAWACVLAGAARAQSTQTVDQGFFQLMRDKLRETRPVALISPYAAPAYSAFLPVWVFHAAYEGQPDAGRDIFEVGFGGRYEMDTHDKQAFAGADFNIIALSARLWSFPWAQSHVRRSKFPPVFVGPAAMVPLEYGEYRQNNISELLKRNLRFMVSANLKF